MRTKVYPYKQGSASAKALASVLNGKVLKCVGSKYVPKSGDLVINWGSSAPPSFGPATTLNADVGTAQCKLKTFEALKAAVVKAPPFWTSKDDIPDNAFPVVCRTVLNGHSGQGIVVAQTRDDLVPAPLYTGYIKKKDEYRVHVLRNDVFFIQRKARKTSVLTPNWTIRNLAGGFAFVEDDSPIARSRLADTAILAIKACGLDFGGVDIVWNEQSGTAYVLEINTACGLEERTALKYAGAINALHV